MGSIRKRNPGISVACPDYGTLELDLISKAVITREIARGRYVKAFENLFRKFIGSQFAVSCSNGTTALHLALLSLGIGKGDEVICPNLTFVAVPNAILYCGAKPVFCDVDRGTWISTPKQIIEKVTKKTKAVIAVHSYGIPCDMEKIMENARFYEHYVIEDCSEALGAKISGANVGSFADASTFSFYGNKTITTGEGGMICTSIPHVSSHVSDLKNHCHFENYYHTDLGYNYRMTNIQAALGFAQMKRLKEILRKKERIRKLYDSYLDSRFERNRFEDSPMDKSICWLYTVLVSDRNRFRERMSRFGIETRPVFIPMNEIPHLESRGSFPNSRFISEHGVSLPSHTNLSDKQIKFISEIANDSGFLSAL